MFVFASKPDPCFQELVVASFDSMIQDSVSFNQEVSSDKNLDDWLVSRSSYEIDKIFTGKDFLRELEKLKEAFSNPKYFYLNNYHRLLLYFVLEEYIEGHNDKVRMLMSSVSVIKTQVGIIDFDALVDIYFEDTDFLLSGELCEDPNLKELLGLEDETLFISLHERLKVHPDELMLTEEDDPESLEECYMSIGEVYQKNMDYPSFDDEEYDYEADEEQDEFENEDDSDLGF